MAEPKTPRNWRARIAALPPIDWAALAQEQDRRNWKRTPRQIAEWMARMAKARSKAKIRRRAAKLEVILARRSHLQKKARGLTVAHRLALALDREHWRTRAELRLSTGLPRDSVKLRLMTLIRDGKVERRKNPEHCLVRPGYFSPVYHHRLTELGEALQREAEFLA